MATIISTKTSGVGGLEVTGDATGILQIASNNGTTAVTVDASQNVGIGTASPSFRITSNYTAPASFTNAASDFNQMWQATGTNALGVAANTTGTVVRFVTNNGYQLAFNNASTEAMRIDSSGNVGIGTASPSRKISIGGTATIGLGFEYTPSDQEVAGTFVNTDTGEVKMYGNTNYYYTFYTNNTERMRIDSNGFVVIGKTSTDFTVAGSYFANNELVITRNADVPLSVNRLTNDGSLINFFQANALEGSISVSGTTVSYNGGHISRWSQLYNEATKVEVYRGTVLESVDAMCEWYDEKENLRPNEQATKTIVSTTPASKAVAGVFDRYDEDDEDNPYDFYVAQSGDFVIRVAAGTVVQNGDLLESAGDGTARVQADDICRSSTIAKVTSNYVSETYADGSFCVPCILMIG